MLNGISMILYFIFSVTIGPFLIKHTRFDEDFFVKIGPGKEVQLTEPGRSDNADQFLIKRVSVYNNYFEIVPANDPKLHLTVMVDWRGQGIRPPQLRSDANGWSYMAIYDQKSLSRNMKPEDPSKCGKDESEAFYISCYSKPALSNDVSYLIVNRQNKMFRDEVRYWIGCVPNIKHSVHEGQPMLFKFIRPQPAHQEVREGPPEDVPLHRERRVASDGGDDDTTEGRDHRVGSFSMDITQRPS